MKRLLLFFYGCLAALNTVDAQSFDGLIIYQEDIKFDFSKSNGQAAPDPQAKQFQAMLGEGVNWGSHLRIQGNKTLYLPDPAEAAAAPPPSSQTDFGAMMRNNMKSKDVVYRDTETEELVEYTDFMGKKFLVTGAPTIKWKMTMEQMTILGYPCFKAIGNTGDTILGPVEAWYAPTLPISSGPKNYGGLPGMILAIKGGDNGAYVVYAAKIDQRPLTAEEPIAKPQDGKPVTREEFIQIKKEKMKEMEGMFRSGSGGRPPMMMMHR
jgi:GLPGLI family protein